MKIVLAEPGPGNFEPQPRAFSGPEIMIGRDTASCDIVFPKEVFPMVSRRHAVLTYREGKWFIADIGSSYGTFVDGQPVSSPVVVRAGSRLQIGKDGPEIAVISIEQEPESPGIPASHGASSEVRIEFVSEPARPSFPLTGGEVWLGREPACTVVFDPMAVMVSRRHARLIHDGGSFVITDNGGLNGTLVNGRRISQPTPLFHGDEIELGLGGPKIRFVSPAHPAPSGIDLPAQRSFASGGSEVHSPVSSKTIAFRLVDGLWGRSSESGDQLILSLTFGTGNELTIGRSEENEIRLDGLQISNRHAKLLRSGQEIFIEDLGSTNGVFVNGKRVGRSAITPSDMVRIGSFLLRVGGGGEIGIFDTRAKNRIDAVDVLCEAGSIFSSRRPRLVDSVSLSIAPNEFIGILGPSGSGKSTLVDALNGTRPAKTGSVFINGIDLYRNFDALKQAIGNVPQDDVVHRELTIYKTLYYTAKLRLSRDVSRAEIDQRISEILEITGLTERQNVKVGKLSGGQRKRVSIAVELVTSPSVIFLDEPTSGLDPATSEKIVRLFRQLAESGRTVLMTTHAMDNVRLFDKIVVLMRGRLIFYGRPEDALKYFQVSEFTELFDRIEASTESRPPVLDERSRNEHAERTAEDWKRKFLSSPLFTKHIAEPLRSLEGTAGARARKRPRLGLIGSVRQWITLSRRYAEVLSKDRLNLLILLAQAPLIAFLTLIVIGADQPRDFAYFILSVVAIWFGTSVAAREIIRERPIYRRERMVNLGLVPYLTSKFTVIGLIVIMQCLLLFAPLKLLDLVGLYGMPGEFAGIPQLFTMLLTAAVGVAIGLLISALVRTSEMATSLVPLVLIPQILFSGLVGVPSGFDKVVGLLTPSAWSFDTMKRFSTLDTLEPEGAMPNGRTGGLGLYRFIERENDRLVTEARDNFEKFKKDAEMKFREYDEKVRAGESALAPRPEEPPAIPGPKKIPEDLSGFVTYLHPWMNEVLNQLVLMLMFGILVISTLIILRLQDV